MAHHVKTLVAKPVNKAQPWDQHGGTHICAHPNVDSHTK